MVRQKEYSKICFMIDEWSCLNDVRDELLRDEAALFLDDIAKVVQETYDIIKYVKEKHFYACTPIQDPSIMMDYMRLISEIALFSNENDAHMCPATPHEVWISILLAIKLVEFATLQQGPEALEGETTRPVLAEEEQRGDFSFYSQDLPDLDEALKVGGGADTSFSEDDENAPQVFKYNVYKKDFTELEKYLQLYLAWYDYIDLRYG